MTRWTELVELFKHRHRFPIGPLPALLTGIFLWAILPLPVIFSLPATFAIVFILGIYLLAILSVEAPWPEVLVYAAGAGLVVTMFSVIIVSVTLKLVGVGDTLTTDYVLTGPAIAMLGLHLILRRSGDEILQVIPIPSISTKKVVLCTVILLLPVSAAAGATAMNSEGGLGGALAFYLSVVLLSIVLFLSDDVGDGIYSLAIYATSLGLIFALSLRTKYVIGADIHDEIRTVREALAAGYWMLPESPLITSRVVSLTVLGPFFITVGGMTPVGLFKVVTPFLLAGIPVCAYLLFKRGLPKRLAYASVLVSISHSTYWAGFHTNNRMGIAVLFSILFLLVVVRSEHRSTLAILFLGGAVVSHYTVAILFTAFLSLFFVVLNLYNAVDSDNVVKSVGWLTAISILFTFFWYTQVQGNLFSNLLKNGIYSFLTTFYTYFPSSASDVWVDQLGITGGAGANLSAARSVADTLTVYSLYVEFGVLLLGALYIIASLIPKRSRNYLVTDYIGNATSGGPSWINPSESGNSAQMWLGALVAIGTFGISYLARTSVAPSRVQAQFQFVYLALLPPGLYVGGAGIKTLFDAIESRYRVQALDVVRVSFVVMIVGMLLLQTGFAHALFNDSISLNLAENTEERTYISENDIVLVNWYAAHHGRNSKMNSDKTAELLMISATELPFQEIRRLFDRSQYGSQYWLSRSYNLANPDPRSYREGRPVNLIYDSGQSTLRQAPS